MEYEYLIKGEEHKVSVEKKDDLHKIVIGDTEKKLEVISVSKNSMVTWL